MVEKGSALKESDAPLARLALLALPILGATLSIILLDFHLRAFLGLLPASVPCGPGGGCEALSQSAVAAVLGIPLPCYGVAFHVTVLLLATAARRPWPEAAALTRAIGRLSAVALLAALPLIGIMIWERSLCILCLAVHAISVGLAVAAALRLRALGPPQAASGPPFLIPFACVTGLAVLIGGLQLRTNLRVAVLAGFARGLVRLPDDARAALERHAILGEPRPKILSLVMDPRCGLCRDLLASARRLAAAQPERIGLRLIFFFGEEARDRGPGQDLARAILLSAEAGRLDPLLDRLLARAARSMSAGELLTAVGLEPQTLTDDTNRRRLDARLDADSQLARRLGVVAVPRLFIGATRVSGEPLPWLLDDIVALTGS